MTNILEKKIPSLLIVAFAYFIAIVVGILSYLFIPIDDGVLWLKLLVADALATTVIYIFSLIFKNASMYDAYWSVQPLVIIFCFPL